ncbi:MAG TPA: hypothetical protein PLP33_14745 [Leptospiraceae bacterium]|nr:hypothetical protein [Leptospiraceae bacterium]
MKPKKLKNKKIFIKANFRVFKEDDWIKVGTPLTYEGLDEEIVKVFYEMLRTKTETGKCLLDCLYEGNLDLNNFEIHLKEK